MATRRADTSWDWPETRHATTGEGVTLAYQRFGKAALDPVYVRRTSRSTLILCGTARRSPSSYAPSGNLPRTDM
jgi:hypothetical protein